MARRHALALSALLLTSALSNGVAWIRPLGAGPRDVRVALVPRRFRCSWPCRSGVVRWQALKDPDGGSPSTSSLKVGRAAIDHRVLVNDLRLSATDGKWWLVSSRAVTG